MTLEEAIKHCEEIAELKYDEGNEARLQEQDKYADECIDCAAEHRQLAEWLKELKKYREENDWTPCSKKLPTEDGDYLVTLEKGYAEDNDLELIIIMNFEVDYESFGYWYERFDQHTLGSLGDDWMEVPVTAWMPLPEPWEGEQDE